MLSLKKLSLTQQFEILLDQAAKKRLVFVKEFKFHPKRRWRLDYAFPEKKVAIEIEGGIYTKGRHTRPLGFMNDCEKYNEATLMGWVVFRLTNNQINDISICKIIDFIEDI